MQRKQRIIHPKTQNIMERKEIKELIEKYRRMSQQERRYGAEKCAFFERVADQIEDNIYSYEDDSFESKEDIINDVREAFAEVDDNYENDYAE